MRPDVDGMLNALTAACKRTGSRVTHQRREVLRAVVQTGDHPDALEVLRRVRERVPTISFDTVYRTLTFLREQKLIDRVHSTGGHVRFDGNGMPHHHFFCTTCGRIIDFESEELDVVKLPDRVSGLGTPMSRQLHVFGICRHCERTKEEHDG